MSYLPVVSGMRVAQSLVLRVVFDRPLFVPLYFFFWSLCCLSFFDLRILIIPLISSSLTPGTQPDKHLHTFLTQIAIGIIPVLLFVGGISLAHCFNFLCFSCLCSISCAKCCLYLLDCWFLVVPSVFSNFSIFSVFDLMYTRFIDMGRGGLQENRDPDGHGFKK